MVAYSSEVKEDMNIYRLRYKNPPWALPEERAIFVWLLLSAVCDDNLSLSNTGPL